MSPWALALGCADPSGGRVDARPVTAWVESAQVDEGAPVVIHAPAGVEVTPPDGMTATRRSAGDDGSAVWELSAPPGSYVVDVPLGADGVETFYVDVGVEGPDAALEPLVAMSAPAAPVWSWVVGGVAVLGAVGWVGRSAWLRFRPAPPPPALDPPHVRARRAWQALRARTDLPPEQLAAALSEVYRDLLEATHPWPARSRTSREILDNLAASLTFKQLESAQRLLGAMDLVKFSEHGARDAVFARLDADFDVLVPVDGVPRA